MNPNLVKARIRRRHTGRGAAMVEAAVIFPVLCVFLGLLDFAHAEYDAKLLTSWDAQNQAWSYAAKGCTSGPKESGQPNLAANGASKSLASADPDKDPAKQKSSALLGVFDTAGALIGSPGISTGSATSLAQWSTYKRTVTSDAWVYCNEQNYNGRFGILEEFSKFVGSYVTNLVNHTR